MKTACPLTLTLLLACSSHLFGSESRLDFQPTLSLVNEPAAARPQPVAPADPYTRGRWSLQLTGSATFGEERGDLYLAHFGVGYFFADTLSINFEGIAGRLEPQGSDVEDGDVYGFDLLLRWHFLHHETWSVYVEGGAGMIWFDDRFPGGGTRQNFTPQLGMGFTLRLIEQVHLMAGIRWHHVSNARKSGRDRNPGFDGAMVYAGVFIPF